MEIFKEVREILSSQLDIEPEKIALESDIMDDLGADSLDIVEFVTELESQYGIIIPQEALDGVRTVGQVVELIESKTK